jgi:transposase
MAHYKETEKGQGLFLTVNLSEQLVPGTFEHTLNKLIDKKLDLSIFDSKYQNDETGAAAIQPGILLKIILYCYSLGIISSRKIAKMCEDNMVDYKSLYSIELQGSVFVNPDEKQRRFQEGTQ